MIGNGPPRQTGISEVPALTLEASSFKLIPRIVQLALLGVLGLAWARLSGFLFFLGIRGLGLLMALSRRNSSLRRRFLFGRRGRRLLLLAAKRAPVVPTPQEVAEEAANVMLEPTEAPREAG